MLKLMSEDDNQPPSPAPSLPVTRKPRGFSWVKGLFGLKADNSNQLREALDDYIEDLKETDMDNAVADNQKTLIQNVLKTHDLSVSDVMIPRADIVAIEEHATPQDLMEIFSERPFSRLPVYKDTLDHIVGTVHVKDILAGLLTGKEFSIEGLIREPLIVSPSLGVMELFVMMRADKKPIAFVVDEFGGIDGLVTLNDVIEAILGDVEDEFDLETQPQIVEKADGSLIADARMDIEEFEERYGSILDAEEREDIETLAGLAVSLAGHVPKRGEILQHSSGMTLEVLEATPRKVNRVRLKNLPIQSKGDEV